MGIRHREVVSEQYWRVVRDAGNPDTIRGTLMDSAATLRNTIGPDQVEELVNASRTKQGPLQNLFHERVNTAHASGLFVPNQGYIGGSYLDGDDVVHALTHASSIRDRDNESSLFVIPTEDPIQKDCGDNFFYPSMGFAKALYEEAFKRRPKSMMQMDRSKWSIEIGGLSMGWGSAGLVEIGRVSIAATGFMPNGNFKSYLEESDSVRGHFQEEASHSFRGSGLADHLAQMGLTYGSLEKIHRAGTNIAHEALNASRSLN
jgi:hypothetical protein